GDTTPEDDDTLTVTLSDPTGGFTLDKDVGTGTIINDDDGTSGVRVGVGDASIVEGNRGTRAATIPVTLNVAPGNVSVSVPYTVASSTADWGKTANSAKDYGGSTSGILTFTGAVTTKLLKISVYGDGISEGDDAVTISLGTPTNATRNKASGTV